MTYTDEQLQELDEFARAVIHAVSAKDPRQLYASTNTQAYQQYYAEVVQGLSGPLKDHPRLFFESDLPMRANWGARIKADYDRYQALALTEAQTEEPESVKAIKVELEHIKAQLAQLIPAQPAASPTVPPPATEEARPATPEA